MFRSMFVDDEPDAMLALRQSTETRSAIRSHCRDWEIRFVHDPSFALAACGEYRPDLVVVLQPKDGVIALDFLGELKRIEQAPVRVILAPSPERRAALDALGVANQCLAAPLDVMALVDAVRRARALEEWRLALPSAVLAARYGELPVAPKIYHRIVQAIRTDASLAVIGEIAGQDPAISARTLRIANSALFAPRHPITSMPLAAAFLGLDLFRPIALFAALDGRSASHGWCAARREEIWRDSLRISALAHAIARQELRSARIASEAFSLGILHDVGALITCGSQDFQEFVVPSDATRFSADEFERRTHGSSHADVGGALLSKWNLPDEAVAVAAWHHDIRRLWGINGTSPSALVGAAVAIQSEIDAGGPTAESLRLDEVLSTSRRDDRGTSWRALVGPADRDRVASDLA